MPQASHTVLAVDDEPSDLEFIQAALTRRGYTVLTATGAREAMQVHARHPGAISLLLTDVAMAPVNGCELATALTATQEDLRVLFVSGHVGEEVLRRGPKLARAWFLRKPFTETELTAKVEEAIGGSFGGALTATASPSGNGEY